MHGFIFVLVRQAPRLYLLLMLMFNTPFTAASVPVQVEFSYEVGEGIPFVANNLRYQNNIGETFSVTRLDWLATGFELVNENDDVVEIPDSTIFVTSAGIRFNLTTFNGEKIKAISFYVGPNKKTNHSDPSQYHAKHPLNPNVNNLHWNWQGGYIFLALEGHWQRFGQQEKRGGYSYHFANNRNRTKVTLALDLEPSKESRIQITLDVKTLLGDLSFMKDGATTHSHSSDPVAAMLKSNLESAFRISDIQNGRFIPLVIEDKSPIDFPNEFVEYTVDLPEHIPQPDFPLDNPLIESRVSLGEKLFHDTRLSRDSTIACHSCHQGSTMSDARKLSVGVGGQLSRRHSMPLFNLAWKTKFFWDGRAPSLREQVLEPIQDPLEMGEDINNVIQKLKEDIEYPSSFAKAFGSGAITSENIGLALEAFLLTRFTFNSKLDQSLSGEYILTAQEKRGFELFFTEYEPSSGKRGADCFHCHGGALFSNHSFNNNGLTVTDDLGLAATSRQPSDRFKFSTPSLRNISLTAPYMHDGRFETLEDVIEHYTSGVVASDTLDPNIAKHPDGIQLSEEDKKALIAFLKAL